MKAAHPQQSVYYYPGTSGPYGDGGYYYPPNGTSSPLLGGRRTGASSSVGSPHQQGGFHRKAGPIPDPAAPERAHIATQDKTTFDFAAATGEDAELESRSSLTITSTAQLQDGSTDDHYAGNEPGENFVGSSVSLSGATSYDQEPVVVADYDAADSLVGSSDQGIDLAGSTSVVYQGRVGAGLSTSAVASGGIASSDTTSLDVFGDLPAGVSDYSVVYDHANEEAAAGAAISFTPGSWVTADPIELVTSQETVVGSKPNGAEGTSPTSVKAALIDNTFN